MSQDDLAARAHISRTYLSLIERDKATNISRLVIAKLAQALDMSQVDFVQPTVYDDGTDSVEKCIVELESILARLRVLNAREMLRRR